MPVEAGSEDLPGVVREGQGTSRTSEELHGRKDRTGSWIGEEHLGETAGYEQSCLGLGQERLEDEEVKRFDHDGQLRH